MIKHKMPEHFVMLDFTRKKGKEMKFIIVCLFAFECGIFRGFSLLWILKFQFPVLGVIILKQVFNGEILFDSNN